jgi:TolB protein
MNSDGSDQKLLNEDYDCAAKTYAYFHDRLAWSNGGKYRLANERFGNGSSICLFDSAGHKLSRVTTLDGENYWPAWAPDQARLAFVSQVDMNDEIYTANIDGTKTRRLTFNTWEWDKHPTWSPDGKYIAFWSNRTLINQIWVMRDDGGGARNISNNAHNDTDPVWIWP